MNLITVLVKLWISGPHTNFKNIKKNINIDCPEYKSDNLITFSGNLKKPRKSKKVKLVFCNIRLCVYSSFVKLYREHEYFVTFLFVAVQVRENTKKR